MFTTPVLRNIAALAGLSLDGRWGTSIRIGKSFLSHNSMLARSRIYRLRKTSEVVFGGRQFHW